MIHNWDGEPISFGLPVQYSCVPSFFFEDDRDKNEIDIICEDNGKFNVTDGHFPCLNNILCIEEPPEKPLLGYRSWTNGTNFNASIIYTCGPNSEFPDGRESYVSTCQWNKTWSQKDIPDCIRKLKPF